MTHTLTDRHRVILDLLAEGLAPKQVAVYMGVSTHTVKFHLKDARQRLGARNTTHAVAIYLRAKREHVRRDGTVVDHLGNFLGIDQPAAAKAYPHGNPKTTSATPAAVVPPLRPRAALVQWLSFKAVDGARRARIIL